MILSLSLISLLVPIKKKKIIFSLFVKSNYGKYYVRVSFANNMGKLKFYHVGFGPITV